MVQKDSGAAKAGKRGRPRAYDPDAALYDAILTFWQTGYSGTSLDDLSAGMGINRPSLYAAFGDKQELYLKALDLYWQRGLAAQNDALDGSLPLREGLARAYQAALAFYLPEEGPQRGCFAIGTATVEAIAHPRVRDKLNQGLRALDARFEARIRIARERGEVPAGADPRALALMASAVLHSLAVRARAGETRAGLEAIIAAGLDLICGPAP